LALAGYVVLSQQAAAQTSPVQATPAPAPPRFVVVLDAAHGGDDLGGKFSDGQPEKTFTLSLSVRLRSLLAARGIQVVTTRESDEGVDLDRRAAIANRANAQACLSLHGSESGLVTRSLALAGALNAALLQAGMNVTMGRTALLAVDSMTCPAVAVEIAPERGPGKKVTGALDDTDYQARVAGALAAALLEWRSEGRQP
jgi:N-acetylmuramoyl-L-alanine amidase